MSALSSSGVVVVTFQGFDPEDDESAGVLAAADLDVRFAPKTGPRSPAEVAMLMSDAVAGVVSTDPFERSVFDACPRLRVLARVGVGVDSIDLDAATEAGVVVTTTPGANDQAVADHTLALILAAVRRVVEADASVRRGEWRRGRDDCGWELHGRTVGIVGLGAIGQAVARRVRGFDCVVLAYDVVPRSVDGVEMVPLAELLERSEIVTVHVPLLEETRGLIGRAEMDLLRPEAIVVNAARGGVVDENALVEALTSGHIRGAALDVFVEEPPAGSPLLALPNVVLSPHVAGLSVDSMQRMLRLAARSVVSVLAGDEPRGIVNPLALAARRGPPATAL
jgi:D-3-phosphoglycerate dehydrogenase